MVLLSRGLFIKNREICLIYHKVDFVICIKT